MVKLRRFLSIMLAVAICCSSLLINVNAASDGTIDFVTRCYEIALGRSPDKEGLDEWVRKLDSGESCGAAVAYGFVYSDEFQNAGFGDETYVEKMYNMLLGRYADEDGKAYWVEKLRSGSSRYDIFLGFANSVEFYELCNSYGICAGYYISGSDMDRVAAINGFVDRLYRLCLDRHGDMEGHDYWVNNIASGVTSGTATSYGFIFSSEYLNKNTSNEEFINMAYDVFFARKPDQAGFDYWLNGLNSGEFSRERTLMGFAKSEEFGILCARYGITVGDEIYPDITYTPYDPTKNPTPTATPEVTPTTTSAPESTSTPIPTPTQTTTPTPTPTQTPTPEPTPTPDPETEALRIAELVGLSKEDLRGEYALFLKFVEAIDENPNLGDYNGYVYSIFPIVADHLEEENEEFFLNKLNTLSINESYSEDYAGGFSPWNNTIDISLTYNEELGDGYFGLTVYHELMHFIDFSINGENVFICYLEDGSIVESSDVSGYAENIDSIYWIEGGAEKYYAEYFTYSPDTYAYKLAYQFIVGMEYIYGKEKVDEIFFSNHTEYLFVNLLQENGFSNDEIIRFFKIQHKCYNSTISDIEKLIDPREVLIRLYINNIGSNYMNDAKFCRILACLEDDYLNSIPSKYRDSISKCKDFTDEEKIEMLEYISSSIGFEDGLVGFDIDPVTIFVDGELKLTSTLALINWVDPTHFKTVVMDFDFDFDKNKIESITIHDQSEWICEPVDID